MPSFSTGIPCWCVKRHHGACLGYGENVFFLEWIFLYLQDFIQIRLLDGEKRKKISKKILVTKILFSFWGRWKFLGLKKWSQKLSVFLFCFSDFDWCFVCVCWDWRMCGIFFWKNFKRKLVNLIWNLYLKFWKKKRKKKKSPQAD